MSDAFYNRTPTLEDRIAGYFGAAEQGDRWPIRTVLSMGAPGAVAPFAYGAAGNGATDDTVALQAAIDAAAAVGGSVDGGNLTYLVSRQGTLTGDTLNTPYCLKIVETQGKVALRNMTIKLANSQAANTIPLLIRGSSGARRTNPVYLENVTIDGNSASQSAWSDFGLIEIAYADSVTLDRCTITGVNWFGLQWFRTSEDLTLRGCRVEYGALTGVRLESAGALICDNTRFVGTVGAAAGTAVDISVNADISIQATLVRVLGNRFTGGFTAVSIAGAESCEVADNAISQLTHASAAAIRIAHYTTTYSARYNVIANNQLRDIRQGILVSGSGSVSANVNRVVNNEIIEGGSVNLANGILETSPADNNDYFQNTIVGATTGITVAGAGSVNSNNRVIP